MLSAHNLAANAVGTDLVRFARCALRSVSRPHSSRQPENFPRCVELGMKRAEIEAVGTGLVHTESEKLYKYMII